MATPAVEPTVLPPASELIPLLDHVPVTLNVEDESLTFRIPLQLAVDGMQAKITEMIGGFDFSNPKYVLLYQGMRAMAIPMIQLARGISKLGVIPRVPEKPRKMDPLIFFISYLAEAIPTIAAAYHWTLDATDTGQIQAISMVERFASSDQGMGDQPS